MAAAWRRNGENEAAAARNHRRNDVNIAQQMSAASGGAKWQSASSTLGGNGGKWRHPALNRCLWQIGEKGKSSASAAKMSIRRGRLEVAARE